MNSGNFKVDYIIIGLGLAGIAFAEQLQKENKTFIVFENESETASLVAGGVYNPVILKRFTPVWNATEQLKIAVPFYTSLEKKLHIKIHTSFPLKKVFKSIEDQNNWFTASDKPVLSQHMNPKISKEKIEGIIGDYGFGEVYGTGRIDTKKLIVAYRKYLEDKDQIRYENFEYRALEVQKSAVYYKNITSRYIVFSEGCGIANNPFFNHLPLNGVKGELLTIHAPDLHIDFLLKSTLFLLPLGNNYYKAGATFNWKDKTWTASEEGREELIEKLKNVIDVPYTVVKQSAGIRPTVKDRRPLVGTHLKYKNMGVLNGLGTRGVMTAPKMAHELFSHMEYGTELNAEINIKRFL
ncbi:MAG: FAD-dependent oxidoreductase [Flavobacteriaceae bacterium]|nr:MAG: FAD-dependent oxidoreductase [Flavobacteriaceae bacterium]